jgi:hypothetical protein
MGNNGMIMNGELKMTWKHARYPILRYCPHIFMEDLRRTLKSSVRRVDSGSIFEVGVNHYTAIFSSRHKWEL